MTRAAFDLISLLIETLSLSGCSPTEDVHSIGDDAGSTSTADEAPGVHRGGGSEGDSGPINAFETEACKLDHAIATCVNDACAVYSCEQGDFDRNGCESACEITSDAV